MSALIIYMSKSDSIPLSGGMLTQGRLTKILSESYDYRPWGEIKIGERLMCSAVVSGMTRRILPTDWVVVEVQTYNSDLPEKTEFSEVKIAYCEKQPLSLDEFKTLIQDIEVASVCSTPAS